jgi:hypothetical protein
MIRSVPNFNPPGYIRTDYKALLARPKRASRGGRFMKNRILLKRVNATTRIVFEDPGGLCLVVKGRTILPLPGYGGNWAPVG